LSHLPPGVDKILYLDTDIVIERSLKPLWDTELGDNSCRSYYMLLQQAEDDLPLQPQTHYPTTSAKPSPRSAPAMHTKKS
jgi:hypothetical protein